MDPPRQKFSRNNNSTLSDGQLISHPPRSFNRGALFELFCMLFVNDGAFVFESRYQLETGIPLHLRHFAKFGLEMHIGKENKTSSTECVLFPTPGYFTLPTLPNSDASTTTSPFLTEKVKEENEKKNVRGKIRNTKTHHIPPSSSSKKEM